MRTVLLARARQLLRARSSLAGLIAVSGLSIASSAVGFMFQVVLAAKFGAGAAIDSYLFAISAPTFLAGLGAAALSYTAIPALVQVEQDPAARAMLLRSLRQRLGAVALGFAAIGLPAIAAQRLLLPSFVDLRQITALPVMIVLGWVIGGMQLFAALFTVELNAARRPVVAALLALPPNLGAIAVVLLAPRTILAAPAGVLAGSATAMALGMMLTRPSFRVGDATAPETPVIRLGRVGWTLMAMSCFSAYAIIDAFWAPRAGSGTLASLGYAQRLVIGIGGLILAGPSAVLTPRFAARLRDRGGVLFFRDVRRTVLIVALVAASAASVLALVAGPLIGVAFGRGAFDVHDVARVSTVFRSMLPGFCAMLVSVVLTRAIYCLEGIERAMALVGAGWSLIYVVACGLLLPMGGVGFGISYSLAWFVYMLIATMLLRRYACRAA